MDVNTFGGLDPRWALPAAHSVQRPCGLPHLPVRVLGVNALHRKWIGLRIPLHPEARLNSGFNPA
eukprot:6602593-Heterocapsa_arctica.AAC.1